MRRVLTIDYHDIVNHVYFNHGSDLTAVSGICRGIAFLAIGNGDTYLKTDDGRYFVVKRLLSPIKIDRIVFELERDEVVETIRQVMRGWLNKPLWLTTKHVTTEISEATTSL